jgi:nucleoside-diphosphate-sugar epimerase
MTICIVGGSGFIGTRLAERLKCAKTSYSIVDIDRECPDPNFRFGDVSDLASLERTIAGDVIVNLAAVHRDDVRPIELYEKINVQGAKNICLVASFLNIERIVFVSSVAVYGFAEPDVAESGPIKPFNEYGRTKWEAEKVFRVWQRENPLRRALVIVRPTVVFGEGNRGNVYNLLRQINRRWFAMIGTGTNVKSMAYVENVAAFLEHCLEFSPGIHTYNYVDKPDLSVGELVDFTRCVLGRKNRIGFHIPYGLGVVVGHTADLVALLTGRSFPISTIRVKKFCSTTQISTAVPSTGFTAPVTLYEGLARTIEYEFSK